jgi:hypothetical protein
MKRDQRNQGKLGRRLNLEKDSPELEAELLKAANGPFSPYSSEEMRAACEQIIQNKMEKPPQ